MANIDVKVPSDLTELYREALINNSYDINVVETSLVRGFESSFAYLYRVQRNKVLYEFFKYKTKDRDLTLSLNDKYDLKTSYLERLKEINLETNPELKIEYDEIKENLSKLSTVDYGDYFINERDEVCITINHDLIYPEKRDVYIRSEFFGKELTISDIQSRPDIFVYYPIFIVDNELILDIKIRMDNGDTMFVLPSMTDKFVLKKDLTYTYHDTFILFIENVYNESISLTTTQLKYYDSEKYNKIPKTKLVNPCNNIEGLFFVNIILDNSKKAIPLQIVREDNEYFYIDYHDGVLDRILEHGNPTFNFLFFKDCHEHVLYHENDITQKTFIDTDGIEKTCSDLLLIEDSNNNPYSMPVPEVNCIVMKNSGNGFSLSHDVSLTMYYPNIYTVNDTNVSENNSYRVFYFYKRNDGFNYTPMHDFYYSYLNYLCDENHPSLESVINAIFFNEYESSVEPERFKEVFNHVLNYRDYRYSFDIFDFLYRPEWTKYPENFKVRKMKEFVRNDYKILADYVTEQKTVGNIYHMFVKNVSLEKRFRRSARLETHEKIAFFDDVEIVDENTDGALRVVGDSFPDFNYETMIRISDVLIKNENVKLEDYVKLVNDRPRYVFALRSDDNMSKELTLRVYIDGLMESGNEYVTYLGVQYVYIPAESVKPNSYIMIEEYYDCEMAKTARFISTEDSHEFTVISHKYMKATAHDVYIKYKDEILNNEDFEVIPIYNGVEYRTEDDEGNEITKFANLSTFKIRILNKKYLFRDLYIRIKKKSYIKHMEVERTSYPRFYLNDVFDRLNFDNIRIYRSGRQVPPNMYELQEYMGFIRIQMKTRYQKGDKVTIDVTPFDYNHVFHLRDLQKGTVINLKGIVNKPVRLNYYDFYSNGRRLGLPHIYHLGAYGVTLCNLKSLHNFDIYEKERDWEYFGYDQLNADGTPHTYYFDIVDLFGEKFVDEDKLNKVIKDIIDNQKHPDVEIEPNTDDEEILEFDNHDPLEEDMRIFYYEDYLPLGFVNPDELQFNKEYFEHFYPDLADSYLVDESGIGSENGNVIFTNPDINTDDLSIDFTVMLTGENNLEDYDIINY